MELHKKYRPKTLDEIVGNESTVKTIDSIFNREQKDKPHAWLFMGQRGSGKSTMGRIVAEHFLGMSIDDCPDFYQIDGGDIKADTIKEIKKSIAYKPSVAKARVYLIEESHMIGQGGASEKNVPQNNFLTTLEEPPKHVYFILCTTDPQRLIKTIHSRCHTFQVNALNDAEMKILINRILKEEEVEDFPEKAIDSIIDVANGCPRDALKILDQVIDLEDDTIIEAIQSYIPIEAEIKDLCQSLVKGESWQRSLDVINKIKASGQDAENVRRAIVGYITKIALNKKKFKRGDEDPMVRLTDIYECMKTTTYANGWGDVVFPLYQLSLM